MYCRRCGTCCEKGGPGLHRGDQTLVEAGHIPARFLFTIRRGELARDNVQETLAPVAEELIKIKGQDGRWTCRFYDRDGRGCGIYDHRPQECRALNCRDTRQIEALYATDRLTRADLLKSMAGLWDLIVDHDIRCGYAQLGKLVALGSEAGRLKAEAAILEILRYDAHLRQLAVETGGMDPGMLDFIFGRSLAETISMFGLRLVRDADCYRLVPTPSPVTVPNR